MLPAKQRRCKDEEISAAGKIISLSPPNCHLRVFEEGDGRITYSMKENSLSVSVPHSVT